MIDQWDLIINDLYEDDYFKRYLLEIIWRSGMSDNITKLIIKMLKDKETEVKSLYVYTYASVINKISEEIFIELISLLETFSTFESISLAVRFIELYYNHRYFKKSIPLEMKELVLRLLMNNLLWNKKNVSSNTNDIQYNPISNYEWNGVVNHLTSKFPETIIEIISKI